MTITHSVYQGSEPFKYVIRKDQVLLGMAIKSSEGFFFSSRTRLLKDLDVRTMKELKEEISAMLPEEFEVQVAKRKSYSLFDVKKKLGLSHNDIRGYMREIQEIFPQMPGHKKADYIFRRVHETRLKYSVSAPFSRKWLEENPGVGEYDRARFDQAMEAA